MKLFKQPLYLSTIITLLEHLWFFKMLKKLDSLHELGRYASVSSGLNDFFNHGNHL